MNSGPMVKRLRHRPFTAVTRVRISLGSLKNKYGDIAKWSGVGLQHPDHQFKSGCRLSKVLDFQGLFYVSDTALAEENIFETLQTKFRVW